MKTFTALLLLFLSVSAAHGQADRSATRPRVVRTTRIAVRVLDRYTLKPVAATIMVVGQRPENPVIPRMENGIYQFKIAANDTTVISFFANGYETRSETMTASRLSTVKVFYLTPTQIPDSNERTSAGPLALDEITTVLHFLRSETDLLPESGNELEILADYMTRNASCRVELTGHTDDVGDPFKNLLLSFDRVDEVKKYLLSRRIAGDRIRGKGLGSDWPVAPNDCEANRRLNRRVEIRITP